ncbi:hypothetical protein, partial [Neorhizobium vignae]|uniref:hypothetical protein n=1 Tax=Neorhizobium vignae TaxID=690585 RepID=UPI001A9A443E
TSRDIIRSSPLPSAGNRSATGFGIDHAAVAITAKNFSIGPRMRTAKPKPFPQGTVPGEFFQHLA